MNNFAPDFFNGNAKQQHRSSVRFGTRPAVVGCIVIVLLLLTSCNGDYLHMREQLRVNPLDKSEFYADNLAARPIPEHTVPRGKWGTYMLNEPLYTGQRNGEFLATFPVEVTPAMVTMGQRQYNSFCSPCHGYSGYGDGMIVQRGMKEPPSFHSERLRDEPVGYYYDVITNGFGAMYSYGSRVEPMERWAIVAYVRALQLSQRADVELLTPAERDALPAADGR